MEMFVERGASRADCAGKIAKKYGSWFHIMREKKIRMGGIFGLFSHEGVEVEFCIPPLGNKTASWEPYGGNVPLPFPGTDAPASPSRSAETQAGSVLHFEEEKKRVLAAAGKNPEQAIQIVREEKESSRRILDELREIKEKIQTGNERKEEHPGILRAAELLRLNDFSESYTAGMLERARKELSLETLDDFDLLQDRLLEWIGESVRIYDEPARPKSGRIIVLVGPTGVGKTTTIAKLAAVFGIAHSGRRPLSVRLITIDVVRIGAREQLGKFGDIMELPFAYIDNRRNLRREIALYQEETDVILIDTYGNSPKDSGKLGELKEFLDACGSRAEIHLVISASTKTSDIATILRQFEPFNYRSVVLTKLDETDHIGNVISVLAERGKSVSWITDKQEVVPDIKKASVMRFLLSLEDFKMDREKMEKRFPVDEADKFEWS